MTHQPATHLYEQIATALRDLIVNGTLAWGERLPTQEAISATYNVSRTVARQALDVLEAEGLIDRIQGGGAYVRRYQPLTRRSALHYRSDPGAPFAEEAIAADQIPRYTHQSRTAPATLDIARRLRITVGSDVMQTDYLSFANERPMMAVISYEPLAITRGTPIERPEEGPIPAAGLVDRFTSIGLRPTRITERLRTRMPRPSEVEKLRLRPGTPVVLIERTTFADQTPIESADLTLTADAYILEYDTPVPPLQG